MLAARTLCTRHTTPLATHNTRSPPRRPRRTGAPERLAKHPTIPTTPRTIEDTRQYASYASRARTTSLHLLPGQRLRYYTPRRPAWPPHPLALPCLRPCSLASYRPSRGNPRQCYSTFVTLCCVDRIRIVPLVEVCCSVRMHSDRHGQNRPARRELLASLMLIID